MFEKLCTIRISGRCFKQDTELEVFTKTPGNKARPRISLIFGKNGSGKTTLSNALREQSRGQNLEGITKLQLLDSDDNEIPNMDEAFSHVQVFNENFIDEKLRVESDGLGSIVMLGEAGDIKDQIRDITVKKEITLSEIQALEAQLAKSENRSDELCPNFWQEKMIEMLKGEHRWASRKKQIDNGHRNATVNENILNRIIHLNKPASGMQMLSTEFSTKLADYQSTGSGNGEKISTYPHIPNWMQNVDEEKILSLLRKPIEKPKRTEREQRIISVVQSKGLTFVKDAQDELMRNHPDLCPYCLRDITSQEISHIKNELSDAITEDVNNHIAELKMALPENRQELLLEEYDKALLSKTDSCHAAYDRCIDIINQYDELLKRKETDPFTPINSSALGFQNALQQLVINLTNLREEIDIWNEKIDQADKRKTELYSLNDKYARLEIDDDLSHYKKASTDKQTCIAELTKKRTENDTLDEKLSSLKAQLNNTYIALSKINTMLAIIFGNKERLKLEPLEDNDKTYRLISRGAHVKPENVSSGERNAIALCYFFTQIGEGKPRGKEYSTETLFVIDDPISSFDFENKIGILSLVKKYVRLVLQGNAQSRAILMTHDYLTMKSLESACKDINKELPQVRNQKTKELSHFSLREWNSGQTTYDTLLNNAYSHACNPSNETREGLGNAARRLLEAFSTFEYGRPFDELALQENNRERISDPFLREYFHDFQFKLALHQESHLQDPVNSMGSLETPDIFSDDGIDRSIREALCLIYLLSKEHILSHLSRSYPDAESQFESWIKKSRT